MSYGWSPATRRKFAATMKRKKEAEKRDAFSNGLKTLVAGTEPGQHSEPLPDPMNESRAMKVARMLGDMKVSEVRAIDTDPELRAKLVTAMQDVLYVLGYAATAINA